MPTLVKQPTLGDLLKFELAASFNREVVTLKGGRLYPLGSVLGRITASGQYRLAPAAAVTGDEGAEAALAVLIEEVDATAGAAQGLVLARGPAILSKSALVYDASVDTAPERALKQADLARLGLVPRDTA